MVHDDQRIRRLVVTFSVWRSGGVMRRPIARATPAESHGFSISEFFGNGRSSKGSRGAAKYANLADRSQTWTGRGRKPNWVVTGLKKERKTVGFRNLGWGNWHDSFVSQAITCDRAKPDHLPGLVYCWTSIHSEFDHE